MARLLTPVLPRFTCSAAGMGYVVLQGRLCSATVQGVNAAGLQRLTLNFLSLGLQPGFPHIAGLLGHLSKTMFQKVHLTTFGIRLRNYPLEFSGWLLVTSRGPF